MTIVFISLVESNIYVSSCFVYISIRKMSTCIDELWTWCLFLLGFTRWTQMLVFLLWGPTKSFMFHSHGPLIHNPNNSSYLHSSKGLKRSIFMFWFNMGYEKFVKVDVESNLLDFCEQLIMIRAAKN